MNRRRALLALLAAAVAMAALADVRAASAFTRIEGEYSFLVDVRKQDRRFIWDFDSNNNDSWNTIQFRIFSQPVNGVEAFVRFEADWNEGSNNNRRPVFQYREAHGRFFKDFNGKGFDSYLFSRQDRFWVDNYLIQVVQGWGANDGGNAQGARIDLWYHDLFIAGPTNLTVIASDFSSQSNPSTGSEPYNPVATDDGYIFRLRRVFWKDKLRLGTTWNRKNTRFELAGPESRFNTRVIGVDSRYRIGTTDLSLEFAQGQQWLEGEQYVGDGWNLGNLTFGSPSAWLPDDTIVKAEIRSLRAGNHRLGYFNVAPSAWYFGPGFSNQLGEGNKDDTGYFINTWYLVPGRAITWTNNYRSATKSVDQQRHVTEFYSEAYVEFVNGFTGRISYRDRTTRDWREGDFGQQKFVTENDDFFAEMQVENRLAWLRAQFRIRDLDTVFQKELAAIESSVNISPTVKLYARFAFGNDPARVRKGLFAELQYRPRPNIELFLSYGPSWIGGGSNPVFEGNLEGSGDNKDLIRLLIRGTF